MNSSNGLNKRLFSWSIEEIRHGQLWPVSIALTLIIACVFALSALAERMEQVIVKQGKDALTADSVFISANPIPQPLLDLTQVEQLESSQLTRFSTMAFSDNSMQLVTVKAVESNYPLRGEMILEGVDKALSNHVEPGELWLDERIFAQLEVDIGDNVTIGDADLTITGRITQEPGLSFNPFQQMPAVLIHKSDIDATGAIQPGSRVSFRLFLNGDDSKLKAAQDSVELTPSDRWRTQDSASRTNDMFESTTQYLSLTVAIVVIMAATTLVLTCQHYVASRRKTIAMLKSLGASKQWIVKWLSVQVSLLVVIGAVLGITIGIGLEFLLRIPLGDLLPTPLPSYGIEPAILAILSSILIGVPALGIPLIGLVNTSAISVIQSSHQSNESYKKYLLLLVPIIPMMLMYGDNLLVWIVLAGIACLFLVLAIVSTLVLRLVGKLPTSTSMRLALSRINRTPLATGIQFGSLALSLMLLSIIWLVRSDLLSDWQQTLPENAPNAFALNIASYEKDSYLETIDANQVERTQAFPIIRGRLTTINGVEASEYSDTSGETDALSREINFTWGDSLPEYNEVLEGSWTQEHGVSVESDVAEQLGLKIGDELSFTINSQNVSAQVNSIRKVEWREMKPNFYFIFTPDVLSSIPSTWLVSFRLEEQHNQMLNELSRNHPTVSLMDIRKMGSKIQELLKQIVWSITVLAALGVVAGLLLIFTLLRLSLSQRQQEIRLYRTLGASKKRILNTIWCEYGLMALVAGSIAALGSELSVAGVMNFGFELQPSLHPMLWIALPVLTFITLAAVVNSLIKRLLAPVNKDFG
ncbi:putative ABC transport system permease protein [Vibrio crassostreae]|uniref:ABC-type transport system involved in lysophospholipase L1 biosynthesis, permease component n=1 Tax=Vibrio crassostreae TaxID=246167 RepID=A0ABP1X0Y1_9VIBR|nr:ABC transporter permease [Vibrio crassostreae]ROO70438.1 putative ABC transport system permease protein [Vibrio crassostreae]ROP08633.1 putative ABC transport system permease protein [Vibrio crassostreae]ROQ75493.1 putative ABC transport system permease protein [Vibrio crassostreae]ROR79865.1 putative ABC transport system permease protein [Vibrio crassostreae]RPE91431.1 putative ABC transport system permease protein [Vibrio crassostreae]